MTGAVKAVVAAMVAVDYLLVGHTQEKKYCHILSQVKLNKNRLGLERDKIPEPQKKFRLLFFSVDRNRTVSKSGGKCLTEILRNSFLHCKAKKTNKHTNKSSCCSIEKKFCIMLFHVFETCDAFCHSIVTLGNKAMLVLLVTA